jgi:hypothetical protein
MRTRRASSRTLGLAAIALASAACLGVSARRTAPVANGDKVPAGTEFTVRLTTPIGTTVSSPGDSFVAASVTSLWSADGSLIAPEGAKTTGRVVGVDEGHVASLRIEFESIETVSGLSPLSATVMAEPSIAARYRTEPIYSTALPYMAVLLPASSGAGEGSEELAQRGTAHRVNLPAGTPLALVLMRPLARPAAAP